jgi:hypothetical protein
MVSNCSWSTTLRGRKMVLNNKAIVTLDSSDSCDDSNPILGTWGRKCRSGVRGKVQRRRRPVDGPERQLWRRRFIRHPEISPQSLTFFFWQVWGGRCNSSPKKPQVLLPFGHMTQTFILAYSAQVSETVWPASRVAVHPDPSTSLMREDAWTWTRPALTSSILRGNIAIRFINTVVRKIVPACLFRRQLRDPNCLHPPK